MKEKGSKLEYIPNEKRTGDKERKTDGSTIRGPKNNKEKPLFSPLAASSFFPLPREKIEREKKKEGDDKHSEEREREGRGGGGGYAGVRGDENGMKREREREKINNILT